MPDLLKDDPANILYEELAQRCAELALSLWHCDPNGAVIIEPPNPIVSRENIQQALAGMILANQFRHVELHPGCWLIPLESRQGSRLRAVYVALIMTDRPDEVARLRTTLRWTKEQLENAQNDESTLDQFSEKLAQAYEETNLLYRMARLLNGGSDAASSIQTMAEQLQEVLPFGWLAIRFSTTRQNLRGLAGRTIIAGELPCTVEQFNQHCERLLEQPAKQWKKVLDPRRDALSTAVNSEVIAEPITHDNNVIGLLIAGNKSGVDPTLSSAEISFLDATADFLSVFHENLSRFSEQQEMFIGTLQALTASIDAKDPYTMGHSQRVGLLSSRMAMALGLDKHVVEQYRIGGLVHDVGKIGVPEAVLCKCGRLNDAEFALIKRHPKIGHRILKDIPGLEDILPGVLHHHEKWDGRGYPTGLSGEQIPLLARVLALADTFDAMSSDRSYRKRIARQQVLEEVSRCAGTQFDPDLAAKFVELSFEGYDQMTMQTPPTLQDAA